MYNNPVIDKVLNLVDFNAIVGRESIAWKGVLGRHGVGSYSDNARLLLEFNRKYQFVITKNNLATERPRGNNMDASSVQTLASS